MAAAPPVAAGQVEDDRFFGYDIKKELHVATWSCSSGSATQIIVQTMTAGVRKRPAKVVLPKPKTPQELEKEEKEKKKDEKDRLAFWADCERRWARKHPGVAPRKSDGRLTADFCRFAAKIAEYQGRPMT